MIKLFEGIDEITPDAENLIPYIRDWATQYHLSPVRTNLFDAVEPLLDKDGAVLELGGGMGAATWWLGQKFKDVDVIEGSPHRAKANKLRNKTRDNVNLFVDDLMNLSFPRKNYKLATLIGVLEYIPYFAQSNNPEKTCEEFLAGVSRHLDEEGILMIAIENKLGAKYFSGCVEDHNSTYFSGLHGYPDRSAITFSRNELQTILERAGYNQVQFYHCFPDYKMPKTIIREDEKMYEWNLSSIARGLFPGNGNRREYLMHDALLLNSLSKAGVMHDFSNSFLVLCSKSEKVNLKSEALITKYSNGEGIKSQFHHKVEFLSGPEGKRVKRIQLYDNPPLSRMGLLKYELRNEPYLGGESLSIEAYKAAIKKDSYQTLIGLFREIHEKLTADYSLNERDAEGYLCVDGKSIDFVMNNLVRTAEGQLHFVDGKWTMEEPLTEDYIIFRNAFNLFQEVHPFIEESKGSLFISRILLALFPQMNESRMLRLFKADSVFHTLVNKVPYYSGELESNLGDKSFTHKMKALYSGAASHR
nr:class I SAM-dependent methyltransferase [Cohnella candidum]